MTLIAEMQVLATNTWIRQFRERHLVFIQVHDKGLPVMKLGTDCMRPAVV